ncbi:MAG: hypothetical protein K5924_11580 [Chloroflexi bacterium]|nr:hypothetical protein [Chloroflexota bacterium]
MSAEPIVYCLTRDRAFATALDERLVGAIAFFFNDAARLHQAVVLRSPNHVVVDTDAIREEYGDAGLGPVVDFLRHRAVGAPISIRPTVGAEHLIRAEAGEDITLLPQELAACVDAVARGCGCD